MKRLLYLGLTALMLFFAAGSANAEDKVKTVFSPKEWTIGSDEVPAVTVTITPAGETAAAELGAEAGKFAVEVSFVYDEDEGPATDVETVKFIITETPATLDFSRLTVGGWYKLKYRLVKGEDQTVEFDQEVASTKSAGSSSDFQVIDPNASKYTVQFVDGYGEGLSTTQANNVTLYYPSVNIQSYVTSTYGPVNAEFYYVFLGGDDETIMPSREAYEAQGENGGKIKKTVTKQSQGGGTIHVIYTDEASAQVVMVKGYITEAENTGGFPGGWSVQAEGESEEYETEIYQIPLAFATTQADAPVFAPAAGEIESGATVKISNFEDIYGTYEMGSVWYSLNGKTPLYGYPEIDKDAGIYDYDDENGIVISGNAGDEVTVKAIAYSPAESGEMLVSEIATATYTIKAAEASEVTITLDPADGATVQKGSSVTVTVEGEYEDAEYKWFATKEEANAAVATFDGSVVWSTSLNPVVGEDPVLAVVAYDEDLKILASAVAEYTITTDITITFNPEDGDEVKVGDTIKLTASDPSVTIVYMMFPEKAIAEVSEWKWQEDPNTDDFVGFVYGSTGYPVITETMKAVKAGYIKSGNENPESTFFHAGYTIFVPDPELTVTAAGKSTVGTDDNKTITFDGMAEFTMAVSGASATDSLRISAELWTTTAYADIENGERITEYSYAGTDTKAEFLDIYNGEYVVVFKLERYNRMTSGFIQAGEDLEVFFNVTNYAKPAEPEDPSFAITSAVNGTVGADNMVTFDGIAAFTMAVGEITQGDSLKINAELWDKAVYDDEVNFGEAITTYSYDATDTKAEFVGVYDGEYVVIFTLDRYTRLNPEPSTIRDTTIIFKVTNYAEPEIVDPSFAVTAAGKNEMNADTVVFDGPAAFTMAVGEISEGDSLKIAAVLYTKINFDAFGEPITTDWYEATDTKAEFIGTYDGEYAVRFELQRYSLMLRDFSSIKDTVIYFTVTNYPEPVVEEYEITVKPVGVEAGENVVFTEENVAFDVFVKGLKAADEMEINVKIQTKAQADAFDTAVVETKTVAAADSVRLSTKLENGEYVAFFELTRKGDRENATVESVEVAFTVNAKVAIERGELAGVKVYPNPTEGDFKVVAPANAQVEIFNAAGVLVKRADVAAGVTAMRLENSGMYFVRVSANGQVAIKKVVIR